MVGNQSFEKQGLRRKDYRMPSEWKAGANQRRDFRQGKEQPEVARHQNKKDTKKWCKGKVGREHDFVRVPWKSAPNMAEVDECTKCGKNFGFFMKAGCDV